jgi:HD-like signal output (HDOD) protein
MPAIWEELAGLRGMFSPDVVEAGAKAFPGTSSIFANQIWDFPVQAVAAKDVLQTLTTKEHDFDSLAALAGRDPILAGNLIKAANSALYGRANPVRSIPEAVGFLGTDITRDLLMALALRPMFLSAGLLAVWKHSLAISRFCQGLACATDCLPPGEALLLGLMHDVGRVALPSQGRQIMDAHARLVEGGCPAAYVERLLFGKSHAEIGAELLVSWLFPQTMVEAVSLHHRPANSSLAGTAALYLAEFWSEEDEDLPSIRHLASAFSLLGCSMEILEKTARFRGSLAPLLAA